MNKLNDMRFRVCVYWMNTQRTWTQPCAKKEQVVAKSKESCVELLFYVHLVYGQQKRVSVRKDPYLTDCCVFWSDCTVQTTTDPLTHYAAKIGTTELDSRLSNFVFTVVQYWAMLNRGKKQEEQGAWKWESNPSARFRFSLDGYRETDDWCVDIQNGIDHALRILFAVCFGLTISFDGVYMDGGNRGPLMRGLWALDFVSITWSPEEMNADRLESELA